MELVLLSCHDPVHERNAVPRRMVQAALLRTSQCPQRNGEKVWVRLTRGVCRPRLRFSS